jgi:hypothetical protein
MIVRINKDIYEKNEAWWLTAWFDFLLAAP